MFVQVIVDFDVIIYEHWTPDLTDPSSQEFQDLANLYLAAFTNSLAQVTTGEVGTLTKISFATIRVMSFTLDDSSFRYVTSPNLKLISYLDSRKRREAGRDNLQQIKAEMETVYNVQGKGDSGKTYLVNKV